MKRWFGIFILLWWGGAWSAASPVRIVSLSPAVTETIFSLGGQEHLVGRSSACDAPEEAKKLPVAGDFGIADVETILRLHPDFVIVHHLVNANAGKTLDHHGIKVLQMPCETVADYNSMVQKLGEILDRREKAAEEIARVEAKLAVWSALPRLPQKILVVVWDRPLIVAGERTFCSELVTLSGAGNVDFKGKKGYFSPDVEYLLQSDPDILLCLFPAAEVEKHSVLGRLRAVREKRVIFPADADAFQRPSPRWCDAVDALRGKWEAKP